jgi:hypothetical protein
MKLTLECQGPYLIELLHAIRASCSKEYVFIILQDDLFILQEELSMPSSWVEIEISSQTFFKAYTIKSKQPKNRIVLRAIFASLIEALQASSAFPDTKVTIKLASAENRVYLEFKCEVPEEDGFFSYEKEVDVMIENSENEVLPEIPNSIECELRSGLPMQQIILPVAQESLAMQICLTVEECHSCKARDKRDLDYVLRCGHSRRSFKMPESGKLTLMTRETSPLQVTYAYQGVVLQQGQCTLYNIKTAVKTKDLSTVLHKSCGLNWNKIVLGIQHESEVIVTCSWRDTLCVRFLVATFIEDNN